MALENSGGFTLLHIGISEEPQRRHDSDWQPATERLHEHELPNRKHSFKRFLAGI
jgi:hypothetical protein